MVAKKGQIENDLRLAAEAARGDDRALREIASFDPILRQIARQTAYKGLDPDEVVQDFWAYLLDKKVFSRYTGENGASLRHFLCNVVFRRYLQDRNKAHDRARARQLVLMDDPYCTGAAQAAALPPDPSRPDQETTHERFHAVVAEAVSILEERFPDDARYYRLRSIGKSFEQIAIECGAPQDDPAALQRATNRIKKQFTRRSSGTMARFAMILERVLVRHGLVVAWHGDLRTAVAASDAGEGEDRFRELLGRALDELGKTDPRAARQARAAVSPLPFAEIALLLGVKEGKKLTGRSGKSTPVKRLEDVLDRILRNEGLELTICKGIPRLQRR